MKQPFKWGFSYPDDRDYYNSLQYDDVYVVPSPLKYYQSGGNSIGMLGEYVGDGRKAMSIKFLENSERDSVKKCLRIFKNFAELRTNDVRFLDDVKKAYVEKYPELFI